jgi:crotonobetainyl-CoA:carnitine CoA-transferase CaiB-like acyl-CoA transferase
MPSSLDGVRVLDLSRVLAGPLCTQILADHGAEVIKVEPPQGDETRTFGPVVRDGSAGYFYGLNRNKTSIVLDLKQPAARVVVEKLLADADVVIENFLPGTMEKWGFGWEKLSSRHPRLVYCSITGFGAEGPLGGLPGYDAVLQAMCGLMSVNGDPGAEGTRMGVPIVDITTGLNAAVGILLALAERARSGRGQRVETCLYDCALSNLHPQASNWLNAGADAAPLGSAHPSIYPYDKFAAGAGQVYLGVSNDPQFRKFAAVLGRADLAEDPRYATNALRSENRATLRTEIEGALAHADAEALCTKLMAAGVPAGVVNRVPEALAHPHTAARQMRVELDGYSGIGIPLKLSRTPGAVRRAPQPMGADTRTVLSGLGYAAAEVDSMYASGAVR